MGNLADEAREAIREERKSLIEFDLKWLFRLADWLFSFPPRPPLLKKNKKKPCRKNDKA